MSTIHTPQKHASTIPNEAIDFVYRNTVIIALAILFLFWGWRTMSPQQLFATEEERAHFLSSAGAAPSVRIITLGTEWCPACKQLELRLTADNIPHLALDIEKNPNTSALFRRAAEVTGSNTVPKIILDRDIVSQPRLFLELARGTTTNP